MNSLGGVQVFSDPCIPKFKEVHRRERKWAHRLMWKRGQRFAVKTEPMVIWLSGNLYCHPENLDRLLSVVNK